MSGLASLFEPEELVGGLWHRLVSDAAREVHFPDAAVCLDDMQQRLEILYHGLGGPAGITLKAIMPQTSAHRQGFVARLAHGEGTHIRARLDGDTLFLPELIDVLPRQDDNRKLYQWLAAFAAAAGVDKPATATDPLQNDILFIRFALDVTQRTLASFPGMKPVYDNLRTALLELRPARHLPAQEAAIENAIRAILANDTDSLREDHDNEILWHTIRDPQLPLDTIRAGAGYKTFLPLVLWGEIVPHAPKPPAGRFHEEHDRMPSEDEGDHRTRKARRRTSDQIDRGDPLIINRFEAVLSWAEMLNINRGIDDDDEEAARKAADDQEELGLANISRKTATKLKFDLDLAPEDVEHERLADEYVYPEWDYRKVSYYPAHCRVLATTAPEMEAPDQWQPDAAARRRIRKVKRQFSALRPRRERLWQQIDGNELDMDALVRARCDMSARGEASSRVFMSMREAARDLSVAVLIDVSRSSESWIEGRQVLDISKEALLALSVGLEASGDSNAIYAFSSLRRERVNILSVKSFDEPLSARVFSRIGALRPGFYTRLGAAMRHVSAALLATGSEKRLLLVLSDGKPNDLDHYEGRYGIEDSAMAVREARRQGNHVFAITIDKKAQSYFPKIFGASAYSIAPHADSLTRALPKIYRHLMS